MRTPLLAIASAALLLSCEDPAGPAAARCGTWSLHYTRSSGWDDTAVLDIVGDRVAALRLAHATRDTLARVRSRLTPAQAGALIDLADLARRERQHTPPPVRTDGEAHRVVTVCDGRADTVDIAAPARRDLPPRRGLLLEVLQRLWRDLLYPRD